MDLRLDGHGAKHAQLTRALRAAMVAGHAGLSGGRRLPATRRLAQELGLSRNTVLAASEEMEGGNFSWIRADLDGGSEGRTAELTFDSDPDKFWHLCGLVITDA